MIADNLVVLAPPADDFRCPRGHVLIGDTEACAACQDAPPAAPPVAYRAFESWLKQNRFTVRETAALLFDYAKHGDMDNVAWFYLERTGDKAYTPATFIKAARLALGMAPEKEPA